MPSSAISEPGARRRTGVLALFGASLGLAALLGPGCGDEILKPADELIAVAVGQDTLFFGVESESQQLAVTGTLSGGGTSDLTADPGTGYVSRNEGVVTVSATGAVLAVASGQTRVVVTHAGFSDSVVAIVAIGALTGLDVTPDTLVLPAIDARFRITVTGLTAGGPQDRTNDPMTTYAARNQAIAGVGAGGSVNAVSPGSTYVVASNSGFSDSALVIVDLAAAIAVDSVTISPAAVDFIDLGETRATNTSVYWENGARFDGSGPPVLYFSNDLWIAGIDTNGVITALCEGSTVVGATLGGKEAMIAVTVAHQVEFMTEILPIFTGPLPPTPPNGCVGLYCHVEAGSFPGFGLQLDSYAHVMEGSDNGPVVDPSDPPNSRIIRALRGTLTGVGRMPQGRPPLPDSVIARIERWIGQGAESTAVH